MYKCFWIEARFFLFLLASDSPYRTPISSAILQLQEGGKLHVIKKRWWKERKGGGKCQAVQESGKAEALGLKNVGGVFVVLISGLGVAFVIAVVEYYFERYRRNKRLTYSIVVRARP